MQIFIATVVSNKTPQTVGVRINYFQKHPKYQKIIKQTTKLLVHNELPDVAEGDTVKIVKSRPFSKLKHFKVVEIVAKKPGEPMSKVPMQNLELTKPVAAKKAPAPKAKVSKAAAKLKTK